jgi:hypothetical protein
MSSHNNSGRGGDGLQVVPEHPGMEVVQPALEPLPEKDKRYEFDAQLGDFRNNGVGRNSDTVFGLSKRRFFILLGLISLLVIGAAVGGGVGGAMAVKHSGGGAKAGASSSSTNTISNNPSSSSTATSSAGTSSSTFSSAAATASATTDCPGSNGITYTPDNPSGGSGSYKFTKYCSSSFTGGTNIAEAFVSTFDHCIEMCGNYNTWHNNATCQGVSYLLTGTAPGNCWAETGELTQVETSNESLNWAVLSA